MAESNASTTPPAGSETLHQLEMRLVDVEGDLNHIRDQLKDKPPLFKTASGLLSVAAFVLSIGSTLYSCQRDHFQEKQQARATINALTQRLLTLPKESVEVNYKYKDDVGSRNYISSLLNTENISMINSMKDLVTRYPSIVTDNDRFVLAWSMQQSGRMPEAMVTYRELADTASDYNVAIAVHRAIGANLIRSGNIDEGRKWYERAISLHNDRFALEDPMTKDFSNRNTYLMQAGSELMANNCDAAEIAINKADAVKINPDPLEEMERNLQAQVWNCRLANSVPRAPAEPQQSILPLLWPPTPLVPQADPSQSSQ